MAKSFLTPLDLSRNALLNALLHPTTTFPSSPAVGQVCYRTDIADLYIYRASGWTKLAIGDGQWLLDAIVGDAAMGDGSGLDADLLDGYQLTQILGRAIHTGTQPASTISDFDTQVRTSRLDQMQLPAAQLDMNGQRIVGLATPTASNHAATKQYVDTVAQGLDFKASVVVATTANITLSGAQTVDAVALTGGERVLVKSQTNPAQNGIYIVEDAGAWSLALDSTPLTLSEGALVFVEDGTTNSKTSWVLSSSGWELFGRAGGDYYQGAGIVITGNEIAVAIGEGVVDDGGDLAVDFTLIPRKWSGNVPSSTAPVLTHNLGTRDVIVQVRRTSAPYDEVMVDVEATTTSTVTLRFAVAPTASLYRATIYG